MHLQPKILYSREGKKFVIRSAEAGTSDITQMAAVHIESFNQSYITHPQNAEAIREVATHCRNKTIAGYEAYWQEQARICAEDPSYTLLVLETSRWINGALRDSIEGFAFSKPVADDVWLHISKNLPSEFRDQSLWHDFYIIHIRDQYRRIGAGGVFLRYVTQAAEKAGAKHLFINAFDGNGSPDWFFKRGARDFGLMQLPYGDINPLWRVTGITDLRTVLHLNADQDGLKGKWNITALTDITENRQSFSVLNPTDVAAVNELLWPEL